MKKSLKDLFDGRKVKNLPKGKTIVYEGDLVDKIYYIVDGYIKVYAFVNSGVQRIVYIYKKGDVFPLTTYLSGSDVARFFYETITPAQVIELSSVRLEKKIKDDLLMGELLVRYTTDIDRQFIKRVNDIISSDPPLAKTVSCLKFLANWVGQGKSQIRIDLPLDAKGIAALSGLSTSDASAQMAYLKAKGVVAKTGSLVIDKNKLKELKT